MALEKFFNLKRFNYLATYSKIDLYVYFIHSPTSKNILYYGFIVPTTLTKLTKVIRSNNSPDHHEV